MKPTTLNNWSNGANNMAKPDRLPEGFVRGIVNLDPMSGGELEQRAGYERVVTANNMRAAVAIDDTSIVYVDGGELHCYRLSTDSAAQIGSIGAAGAVAATCLNGRAYLCSPTDSVRTDGDSVVPWSVSAPDISIEVVPGVLPAGIYKVALVAIGADGEESGVEPMIVRVSDGEALRISSSDSRDMRLYVSVENGATLYSQGPLIAGVMAITKVNDDSERLTTTGLVPMPACSMLATYHAIIVGAYGNYMVCTVPMYPHLTDPVSGFFQFDHPPAVIAPTDGGIYVVTDKTYFITGIEGGEPVQRMVMDVGAIEGSAVRLPDGTAAWFTRYGQAIGNSSGEVSLPNQKNYAPDIASVGAAGVVERNGNSLVVTAMRGTTKNNNLATGDFADLEIDDGQ